MDEQTIEIWKHLLSGPDSETSNIMLDFSALLVACPDVLAVPREPAMYDQRLQWGRIMGLYGNRAHFIQHLRMSKESFDKLLSYIQKDLETDEEMAKSLRGGAILPGLRLYCTIRWLSGGSYSDILLLCGISPASFYRVVWQTIEAINKCEQLTIRFPQTRQECKETAEGFEKISFGGAIDGCVGAIDGWLLKIDVPSRSETSNVRSFFSGHYQCYGMNVQAVCDHHCRFTYLAVLGPGDVLMGDNEAFHQKVNGAVLRWLSVL